MVIVIQKSESGYTLRLPAEAVSSLSLEEGVAYEIDWDETTRQIVLTPVVGDQQPTPSDLHLSAGQARQLVNRELVPELGTGLGAGTPILVLREQHLLWQVPLFLSLPGVGRLGEVGLIFVNARTGTIINDPQALQNIINNAHNLYTATLPTE